MPANYDFRCPTDHVFEAVSSYGVAGVMPVACPECGEMGRMVWLKAPGIHSDGAPPADRVAAARSGIILTKGQGQEIEPFKGSTRKELEAWETRNNVSPVSGDEIARIPERKYKPSEDPAVKEQIERRSLRAFDMVDAGKTKELYQPVTLDEGEKELLVGAASTSAEAEDTARKEAVHAST